MAKRITKGQLDNGYVSAWFSLMNLEIPEVVVDDHSDLLKSTIRLVAVELLKTTEYVSYQDAIDSHANVITDIVADSVRNNQSRLLYTPKPDHLDDVIHRFQYNIASIIFSEYLRVADPSPDATIRLR